MYKNVNLEVIYILILTNNALKNNSKKGFFKLLDFFSLNSIFDIKTYFILHSIFINSFDLSYMKAILTDKDTDINTKFEYIKKFKDFLLIYIKNHTNKINIDSIYKKLNNLKNILKEYKQDELVTFLSDISEYIYINLEKKNQHFILYSIYNSLEEYFDLFLDANKIVFNSNIINKQFKTYFDLIHIEPKNICFINKKNNIKIMQNFFQFDIICKIFSEAGYQKLNNPNKKYLLIEYDKNIVSNKSPELLLHETGHFLNLKIYNFQETIANELYKKDSSINIVILNYWLNEIIADIIGYKLCKTGKFIEVFDALVHDIDNIQYPPKSFRKVILEKSKYNFDILKTPETRQIAKLIYNNIELIKSIIYIK